jgi:hypothetical protein
MLNEITSQEFRAQVGEEAEKHIRFLRRHLYGIDEVGIRARVAPSITTRGEAEIFGLSSPRFAYRVWLDSIQTSFVNIRRIKRLRESIHRSLGEDSPGLKLLEADAPPFACIADSLLAVPI